MVFSFNRIVRFSKTTPSRPIGVVATIIAILVVTLCIISCSRIKKDGHQLLTKTKEKIKDTRDRAVDKAIPTFDSYTPDTKFNKKRFKEFLEVEPTADVKGIYCYDDAIGIDGYYEFAFTCDDSTIQKIIKQLKLTKTVKDSAVGLNLGRDFPWWDTVKISKIDPYWKKGAHEPYWYLWYDKKNKNAYFQTYDM